MTACVLFDLDETVLDRTASLRAFVDWQTRGMLRADIKDTEAFAQRFIELDDSGRVWKDKVFQQLLDEFSIQSWTVNELLQSYILCFCGFCVPRQGILSALDYLKNRACQMAIVTNGMSPFQERNARALSTHQYFDSIVVSEAVGIRKPDKEIFQLACDTLNAEITESIFVGDNLVADISGAKQAGMKTIFTPTDKTTTFCTDADAIVTDLAELPDAISWLLTKH